VATDHAKIAAKPVQDSAPESDIHTRCTRTPPPGSLWTTEATASTTCPEAPASLVICIPKASTRTGANCGRRAARDRVPRRPDRQEGATGSGPYWGRKGSQWPGRR
jgi:hypothetical protein